ncbi:hypothetical protein [Methylobacterium persicinum]|uniref:Uncharacterized protein n=1 Tax=Methylobacterium persicinum TaxID=374426 RepID=A0ABU0HUQ8_9HYPH|nr:hypothetical protein [Methylobacterium persicinum]MDQ0445450.1 hypothetical protein [Methylobacterium persicinum]
MARAIKIAGIAPEAKEAEPFGRDPQTYIKAGITALCARYGIAR